MTATLAVISSRNATSTFENALKEAKGAVDTKTATALQGRADALLEQGRRTTRQVGLAALLFALAYGGGTTLGSWLRISGLWGRWLAPLHAPWATTELDFKEQSDWLVIQQGLLKAGVPLAGINSIFEVYEVENTKAARRPVLPWREQPPGEGLTYAAVTTWLAVEPRLSEAGMTDEELRSLWPSFLAGLVTKTAEDTASDEQGGAVQGATDETAGNVESSPQQNPFAVTPFPYPFPDPNTPMLMPVPPEYQLNAPELGVPNSGLLLPDPVP